VVVPEPLGLNRQLTHHVIDLKQYGIGDRYAQCFATGSLASGISENVELLNLKVKNC
jgi:hypothetical protein